MADEDEHKRQRDEILEVFQEKRQKLPFEVTSEQPKMLFYAEIIMYIIIGSHTKAAELLLNANNDFNVYALELALKSTPYHNFFKQQNIWYRYRRRRF